MSSISCAVVGLPNVGKSTLFNALTKSNILVANYPFATIEPNVGIVNVPDQRLIELAKIYQTEKITPATIKFIDIAGLVEGAHKGEGLGNQFLAKIRTCNAIIHVVKAFKDKNIDSNDNFNPKKDIEIINTELALADLSTVDKRLLSIEKEYKANPKLKAVLDTYHWAKETLEQNIPLRDSKIKDVNYLNDLQLLTLKPVIYLFNLAESDLENQKLKEELSSIVKPTIPLFISAKLEDELKDLDDLDKKELLLSYNQKESGLIKLINSSYTILNLESFLTAGKKEVRAWTIKKGTTAPQAAGVIHQDFERGFIAAEVIDYQDLINFGSYQLTKLAGKIRTEGKNYVMQENDIAEFRFNV